MKKTAEKKQKKTREKVVLTKKPEKKVRQKKQKTKTTQGTGKKAVRQPKKNGKIRYKLIGAFIVPVCLIVLLGILSYQSASKNIKKQYENSVDGTLTTVSEYCHLLCNTIEDKTVEIITNDTFSDYFKKYAGKNDSEAMSNYRASEALMKSARGTVNYIYSYNVFSENGGNMSSTSGKLQPDAYKEFEKSDEAAYMDGNKGVWTGYHKFIDDKLSISTDSYVLSYTKPLAKGKGYVNFDVSYAEIRDILSSLDNGKGTIAAMVAPRDGREVLYIDGDKLEDGTTAFIGTDYLEKAATEKEGGQKYVKFNGKSYLFAYSPVGKSGLLVCVLVPKSTILSTASSIRTVTIAIVIVASIIALFIGSILAKNISKEVTTLTKTMDRVSEGDFTTVFSSKRRDEFQLLSRGMTDMMSNVRGILQEMLEFSNQVSESSVGVSKTAETMADSMNDINIAIEEVALGVGKQADDSEHSLTMMSEFSNKLNEVYDHTNRMEQSSDSAMQAVERGKEQIAELNQKSEAATEMTRQLVADISDVSLHSNNIGSIIETIQAIAEQTNLLSLNASIEAARAGDAGRGFAVVAEEIRNLADQSAQAGSQIKEIIENIQHTTDKTTVCAQKTEEFLEEQSNSINETIEAFGEIAGDVEQMVEVLHRITENMSNMIQDKDSVLESIQSIATVSEQAAASTEEVTATVNTQLDDARGLANEAEKLSKEVQRLNASMQKFQV